jgi:DNA topoisomerase VI subunit A
LKVGDRIAVARRIDISENRDPIDLYEVFKSAPKEVIEKLYVHLNRKSISKILKSCDISEIKYITLYEWKKFNRIPLLFLYKNKVPNSLLPSNSRLSIVGGRHEYPLKISKSKDLGIVLGYLLSEGSNTINNERDGARTVSFSNKSKLIMREFIDSFSKVFGKPTTKILISKKIINGKAFYTKRINIGYDLLSYILEYAFDYPAGIKSEAKRVPSILLDAPKECIEGFLYSYVKGDGTHQSTRYTKVIRIYSSSKEMINSIAFLLLRFGIFPRICTPKLRTGRKQEYILYVSSKEYVKKLNEITGSFQSPKFNDKSTTEDYLPVKKIILAAKKLCKIPDREYKRINFYTKTKNISRPKVRRLINILEKYSNSNPHLDKLKTLVDSDIYWDEIKEINFDEAPYTLDLSVVDGQEPIENFLGGFGWICLHNSNEIVEDLEVLLGAKREDLNLSTDRKGVVAGPLIIKDKFAGTTTTIDCTKMGRSGWMIPSDVDNGMEFVKCDADYVLCIEKDALWQRLNEDQFWKKENCLIITPKGQASRGCRRLIRKLADMKLPIYCYMDCDAWGWYIYWTIKTGSMNLAYLGSEISTPEAKFLGVTMKDIERYPFLKKLTIRAKDVDIKRAEEMLSYPWISMHKEWVEELKTVLETKKKLEQDALQGPRLTFVGDYIREKINNKEFLP